MSEKKIYEFAPTLDYGEGYCEMDEKDDTGYKRKKVRFRNFRNLFGNIV